MDNHPEITLNISEKDQFQVLYSITVVRSTLDIPEVSAPGVLTPKTFLVKETIDRHFRDDRPEPAGVILVLEGCRPKDPELLVDQLVSIRNPSGLDVRAKVAAVRDHDTTISLLIPGLNRSVVPVGSTVVVARGLLEGPSDLLRS